MLDTIGRPDFAFWFVRYDEANDWLSFDADLADCEAAAWREPDHYAEWVLWWNRWESEGFPEF